MKLYLNPPSPYARKVVVMAHELHLQDHITVIKVDPWSDPQDLIDATPLCKVPALITTDGCLVVESTTICEQLMLTAIGALPRDAERMEVMSRVALANGVMDAAFVSVIEARRPEPKQWQEWIDRQRRAITRAIPMLKVSPADQFDLGDVTLACALAYLDFRLPGLAWRETRQDLAEWLDRVNDRPSMQASQP